MRVLPLAQHWKRAYNSSTESNFYLKCSVLALHSQRDTTQHCFLCTLVTYSLLSYNYLHPSHLQNEVFSKYALLEYSRRRRYNFVHPG